MLVRPIKTLLFVALAIATACGLPAEEPRVLVYTRNYTPDGKGYVHDNIAASVSMLKELGAANGFAVDASDDPAVFTDANLANYAALIFANSNNEAFADDAQRAAFELFIRDGGGFVGIHSASGSERAWPFYWATVGGKFKRHPPIQPFDMEVLEPSHPAVAHLGAVWRWEDEFYYHDNLNPRARVILAGRLTDLNDPKLAEYPGTTFGELFPLAWCFEEHGGRRFYTALGHKIEYYADPDFRKHVLGGVLWVLRLKD
ncbi:MAG TPA: ThuA domain-containing protein [Opitutaceae bacterium]|nr:ThuA domain-containing protein [Opitutaceae bacterium]